MWEKEIITPTDHLISHLVFQEASVVLSVTSISHCFMLMPCPLDF